VQEADELERKTSQRRGLRALRTVQTQPWGQLGLRARQLDIPGAGGALSPDVKLVAHLHLMQRLRQVCIISGIGAAIWPSGLEVAPFRAYAPFPALLPICKRILQVLCDVASNTSSTSKWRPSFIFNRGRQSCCFLSEVP
jgi:hypothetical protein